MVRNLRKARRGFTLIEALVTVVVVGVIMVALWESLSVLVHGAALVKQKAQASQIAADHLAEAIATWQWQTGMSGDDAPNEDPDQPAMYHWTVDAADFDEPNGTSDLHQVDCTVSWNSHGQPYSITLSTLMFDQEKTPTETTTQ